MIKNILSISGGKDSTAMLLLAMEREVENLQAIFCDTGNEQQQTYDYVDYLENKTGIKIVRLKASFESQIEKKREYIKNYWPEKIQKEQGISAEQALDICARALNLLRPTGNPFLDLCMWKGRFPSTKAAFCSLELKRNPADKFILEQLEGTRAVISWQGIRRDESARRAGYEMFDVEFGNWGKSYTAIYEPPSGHLIYRPIINWSAEDVFAFHRKHNIKWNPLYEQGMARVGCMPCVNCRKSELAEIAKRFPEEIKRIDEWERLVGSVSKRGNSTFFPSTIDPVTAERDTTKVSRETHGIIKVVDWAKTSRGGRQHDLFTDMPPPVCQSMYGLCE